MDVTSIRPHSMRMPAIFPLLTNRTELGLLLVSTQITSLQQLVGTFLMLATHPPLLNVLGSPTSPKMMKKCKLQNTKVSCLISPSSLGSSRGNRSGIHSKASLLIRLSFSNNIWEPKDNMRSSLQGSLPLLGRKKLSNQQPQRCGSYCKRFLPLGFLSLKSQASGKGRPHKPSITPLVSKFQVSRELQMFLYNNLLLSAFCKTPTTQALS